MSKNEDNSIQFDFNPNGWVVNYRELSIPERGAYSYIHDKFFESLDEKYACLYYNIFEYHMRAEAGLVGIFENKDNPLLALNPKNKWFDYQNDRSVMFYDDLIFVRLIAYNENNKLSGTPFVVFDMIKRVFGFVDFDWSSIYYSIVKVSDAIFKFHLDHLKELSHSNTPQRDKEQFDISLIKYYPLNQIDNLLELYFEEKRH